MWYDDLFLTLEAAGNPQQAAEMAAYMQNRFPFLGVPKSELKALIKPYLKASRKEPFSWSFVDICWRKDYREAQYVGIEYLKLNRQHLSAQDLPKLKALITNKAWWETADNLDALVGGVILNNRELEREMLAWSGEENLWLRRVAIDFQQTYKEQTNPELLKQIIENNINHKDPFIQKAIKWSLKEYDKVRTNASKKP